MNIRRMKSLRDDTIALLGVDEGGVQPCTLKQYIKTTIRFRTTTSIIRMMG